MSVENGGLGEARALGGVERFHLGDTARWKHTEGPLLRMERASRGRVDVRGVLEGASERGREKGGL